MKRLDLVFLWHMHQPDYRDRNTGEFVLPWTCLHALKDYTDMAGHLERHPAIHAVVNFVPVLLDQIEDYCRQFETKRFRDPLLHLLAAPDPGAASPQERRSLLDTCFRCHAPTMRTPFAPYQRLHDLYAMLAPEGDAALDYLSGAYCADLVTWYFLAWSGETLRRQAPLLAELMAKGAGFTLTERRRLLDLIGRTLADLMPRYRALQARGQIELSTTPAAHPLAPLLLDFSAARESLPAAALPAAAGYPGGRERVHRHLAAACESHTHRFGTPPAGLWPAEGAISTDFARQIAAAGYRWAASGEQVLRHSLSAASPALTHLPNTAHRPWHLPQAPGLTLFFRDDVLSDRVGFEYSKWHGRDAAADFIARLEAIAAAAPPGETPVVSIILDGENAWEYYPYNGYYFLDDLYGMLAGHPVIRTRTCSERLDDPSCGPSGELPQLTAGSWVHGTLSTWIGDPSKNRAWDLLCAAKQSYDRVVASGRLTPDEREAAQAQLANCESSDWFWWFGDYNPAPAVASFDQLFRTNLGNLYRCLHLTPPAQLDHPVAVGSLHTGTIDAGGTMRRADAAAQPDPA